MDSSSLSHTKWKCQYHIVFIPKYRRKVMYGKIKVDVREILRKLCEYKGVTIVEGAVCSDHVHICVSIPPKLSVSQFVGYLKGKSALMIFDKHPEFGSKWTKAFWARGYYVSTVGNITEDAIKKYIQEQQEEAKKEETTREYKYLLMATLKGVIKKTDLSEFSKIRANGLTAIKLDEGDELIWVKATTGNDEAIILTKEGKSVRFKETDVRPMGRSTRGVTGIKFRSSEDTVVGMGIVENNEQQLLTLSEHGFGKMTPLKEYATQKRGGTGIFTFRVTSKTGNIACARILRKEDTEIVVISEKSKVIRADLKDVPKLKRQTSGVKMMNINSGDSVAAVAIL